MTVHRVDLDEAVAMVLRGEITNAAAVAGVLAAARARDADLGAAAPAPTRHPPARVDRSAARVTAQGHRR